MTDGNIYSINKYLDEREGYSEPKASSWENREIELDGATYVLKLKGEAYAAEMEARLAKAVEALAGVDGFVKDLAPYADPSHNPVTPLARACEVYAELKGEAE